MGVSAKSLGIDRLSVPDRLALVEEIWAGICADDSQFPWTAAQRAELISRESEDDQHPATVIPAETVFLDMKERLAKRS